MAGSVEICVILPLAFKLKPGGEKPVDLRCYLTLYGEALTETWTYLWKPTGGA